jgi:ribosomal protein L30E
MKLRDAIKNKNKIIYGTENILKNSKSLTQVFVSKNYPSDMMENLTKVLGKIEITQVKENSEEMGTLLRKPFLISVIGIKK